MATRHESVTLLRTGLSIREIAKQRSRTLGTIVRHLAVQLREGDLRPEEVVLACRPEDREHLDNLFTKHKNHTYRTFEKHACDHGFTREEAQLYYDVCRSTAFRGDLYVTVADIEVALHAIVRQVLMTAWGSQESEWWRKGVPASVRKACVQAREEDLDPVKDPYCYTTFIHLSEIIDSNWAQFQKVFADELVGSKKSLLSKLRELNQFRNAIMHPVKHKTWRDSDLKTLKDMRDLVANVYRTPNPALHPSAAALSVSGRG